MNICDDGHDDVVYEGRYCPVCKMYEYMSDDMQDLRDEIKDLKEIIKDLENRDPTVECIKAVRECHERYSGTSAETPGTPDASG